MRGLFRNLSGILLILLCSLSIGLIHSQRTLAQDYTCPEETFYQSETPFTLQEVETIVGFNHPALQELTTISAWELSYSHPYFFDLSCTPYNNTFYVGILFLDDVVHRPKVLVFQIEDEQIVLATSYNEIFVHRASTHISNFADRNFNGLPELFITGWHGGSSPGGNMQLLELDENNQLIDITPETDTDGPLRFDEINGDGIPELYDHTWYYVPTFFSNELFYYKWLGWTDTTYELVAVRVSSFPNLRNTFYSFSHINNDSGEYILNYLDNLTQESICVAIVQTDSSQYYSQSSSFGEEIRWKLFHILLYYYMWGNIGAGWEYVDAVTAMAENCPESEGKDAFFESLSEYEIYFHTR